MRKHRGGEITDPISIGFSLSPFSCGMSCPIPYSPNPIDRNVLKTLYLLQTATTNLPQIAPRETMFVDAIHCLLCI